MKAHHVLIAGSGSVGRRHARNLAALGCSISCVDPRKDRRDELAAEVPVITSVASLAEALSDAEFDGVVIGSPTAYHIGQAAEVLARGLPVFLEKPVSTNLAEARALQAIVAQATDGRERLLMGYTWRWWPPLARTRELVANGVIGRILNVQFNMSAHLADWHPWERYQDFFMASVAQGGGALLDESHWIDLKLWFFGYPDWIWSDIGRLSSLEIETDDNVEILAGYSDGLRVSLHLDLYGRPHAKSIRFVGEEGSLVWSEVPNRIAIGRGSEQHWEEEIFLCQRNEMFSAAASEFLAMIDGAPPRTCTIADGVAAMRVIEAARLSSSEGRRVRFEEVEA